MQRLLLAAFLAATACHAVVRQPTPALRPEAPSEGMASFYGESLQGRETASGERFDLRALTAAHRTLPFGTIVRVTNLDNGAQVTVRINDRGPYAKGRILDLSMAAARALGMIERGHAQVRLEILSKP